MNSDVIRLLPDSVANQIAAGEVIQRPASVVKELVENAIDAGAKAVSIIIRDAGRTLIQVVDDGCGMSPTDARMAFERHATSKISSAADLYSLHTMGFRGEALASIAAVAQIDLRTMREGQSVGTRLQISESRFESQEACVCAAGTNIMVKNIFFHMPARRKFLKKDSVELGHILREFERLALVNTGVDFTLIHNDATMHQLVRGTFKQRIGGLFGKTLESQLAPMSTETSLVKIGGYIGMPRYAKRRGAQQFFFVNGRNMRHPLFHKAVMRCYEPMIAPDTMPCYFINFEVAPETIDVNIHPQKYEIKFEHEQAIFQILEAAVKETLGKTQAAGALDFDSSERPDIPLFAPDDKAGVPSDDVGGYAQMFGSAAPRGGLRAASWNRPGLSAGMADWNKLYESFSNSGGASADSGGMLRSSSMNGVPDGFQGIDPLIAVPAGEPVKWCAQWLPGYIVALRLQGLTLVNQHRAHERILYERIMQQMAAGTLSSQKLIFPEDIELPPDQGALLTGMGEGIESFGFGVKWNGGLNWTIEAVPAVLASGSAGEALQELLAELPVGEGGLERLHAPAALTMARRAAISPDKVMGEEEMRGLISDLFACQSPACTPDGLPVYYLIDSVELERRF